MPRLRPLTVLATLSLAAAIAAPAASADTIRVQSTTDTIDAGLVTGLLQDAYAKAQPGDTLDYVGVGTGKALDNARAGLADVVITHAPSLEATFVSDGFSLEPIGRAIFYSDYVLVGPASDPAGVLSGAPHDAIAAFEKIAAAGAAGQATFVSRGDNSGTNVQEQTMWGLTDGTVEKQAAVNGAGSAARKEPGTGGTYPNWYEKSNKGQAASLQVADVCATSGANPNGNCYTIVDRGTFNRLLGTGTLTTLKIVTQQNATGARGGENLLINPFSAYVVNPDKISTNPKPNTTAGLRFLDFLTSESFQTALEGFPSAADPAFRGDAFPKIDATLPSTAPSGGNLAFQVTVTDRLPGGGVIDGLPLQLEQSTDGGTTFSAVGSPVTSDGSGKATLSATATKTAEFRVSWGRYRKFSPSTAKLGAVTVTPAATPAGDKIAPVASKLKLTERKLKLTVSEGAKVEITVARRTVVTVKGKRRHRYSTVKRKTISATKAGTLSSSLPKLRPGTYRVTVTVTDAAGNHTTTTKLVTLRGSAS